MAVESLQKAGLIKKTQMKQFQAEPFVALKEFAERAENMIGSRDKLMADIMINTRDELQSFINACSILNCANVIVDTITPADIKKTQFVRGKRVKPQESVIRPHFTYKVLQISDEQRPTTEGSSVSTGFHSKRMHLRRGHIRRLGERLVWVRPAVINPGSVHGAVAKDYQLNKSAG